MSEKWGGLGLNGKELKWIIGNVPWQLKKSKAWGTTALPIQIIYCKNGLNWQWCLAGSSKTAPRILIFPQNISWLCATRNSNRFNLKFHHNLLLKSFDARGKWHYISIWSSSLLFHNWAKKNYLWWSFQDFWWFSCFLPSDW